MVSSARGWLGYVIVTTIYRYWDWSTVTSYVLYKSDIWLTIGNTKVDSTRSECSMCSLFCELLCECLTCRWKQLNWLWAEFCSLYRLHHLSIIIQREILRQNNFWGVQTTFRKESYLQILAIHADSWDAMMWISERKAIWFGSVRHTEIRFPIIYNPCGK